MKTDKKNYPRLYFSREELIGLRVKSKQGLRAEMLAMLTDFCDRLLDPNEGCYFDYKELKKDFWRQRAGRWIFEPSVSSLAIAYAFTGDERYGIAARDAVFSVINNKLCDNPNVMAGYGVTKGWRHGGGQDKGGYAWAISQVFDLCHDLFSKEQHEQFIAHVRENMDIAMLEENVNSDYHNWVNNRGCRATTCCYGIYWLLLEGEMDLDPEILDMAIYAAEVNLHTALDQDGVSYEGGTYGSPWEVAEFAWMLRRSGRVDLLRNRRFDRFLSSILYELLPGDVGDINPLNDCEPNACTISGGVLLSPIPPIVPWLLRRFDLHPNRTEKYREPTKSNENFAPYYPYPTLILYVLLNWDDEMPVRTPQELGYPISRQFPQRGIADMRTGWEKDDYLVAHFCGYQMYNEHSQSDQNHLALYALGEQFLVDENYGQASVPNTAAGQENYRYYSRADLHNTVIYDGIDQNGNMAHGGWVRWAEGRIIDWQSTPDFDTSLGDAAGAYGPDHTIEKALRRVIFVKNTAHPFVIVLDVMDVDGKEHDFEVLWRTHQENQIEVKGNSFKIIGSKHDCHGQVLVPKSAELRTITHYNQPQLRVRARSSVLEMITLLTPLPRGESPPTCQYERLGKGDYRLTIIDGANRHTMRVVAETEGILHTPIRVEHTIE